MDSYADICRMMPDYVKKDKLSYDNLEDYQVIHYASDHHWNEEGSRRGYEDIYNMISREQELSPMYLPEEKADFSNQWGIRYRGSYANRLQELYSGSDEFSVYRYSLPNRQIYAIELETGMEIELDELGLWEEYESGQFFKDTYTDHYVAFYGYGKDEVGKKYIDSQYAFRIKNNQENPHNLLICSESYGRAFRDVLASHFGTTIYLDYRVMSYTNIDSLIEHYDIDTVVFCSNKTMWIQDEFIFTFSKEILEGEG